jgi:hypothetical protein
MSAEERKQKQQEQKKESEKVSPPEGLAGLNNILGIIFRDVLSGTKTMQHGEEEIRGYIKDELSAGELDDLKATAAGLSRRMVSVAEGMSQCITVAASQL